MVDRITYGDKEPGDSFTADDADEIRTAVNALGTAADVNTGTTSGCVPLLNAEGKIPAALLPEGLGGGDGSGDVVGPSSSTDGRVALFDGDTGKLLKEGTTAQLVPSGTTLYWLQMIDGVPTFVAPSALKTSLETLTTTGRLSYSAIDGLDSSDAADLYADALITDEIGGANVITDVTTATYAAVVQSSARGIVQLGDAALEDLVAEVAPTPADVALGTSPTLANNIAASHFWRLRQTVSIDDTSPFNIVLTGLSTTASSTNHTLNVYMNDVDAAVTWQIGAIADGLEGSEGKIVFVNTTSTARNCFPQDHASAGASVQYQDSVQESDLVLPAGDGSRLTVFYEILTAGATGVIEIVNYRKYTAS